MDFTCAFVWALFLHKDDGSSTGTRKWSEASLYALRGISVKGNLKQSVGELRYSWFIKAARNQNLSSFEEGLFHRDLR